MHPPIERLLKQRGLLELKDLPQAEAQARKVLTMELSETTGWDSQESDRQLVDDLRIWKYLETFW